MKIYLFLKVVIYLAAISYSISNTKRVYEYNLYVLKENIVDYYIPLGKRILHHWLYSSIDMFIFLSLI